MLNLFVFDLRIDSYIFKSNNFDCFYSYKLKTWFH